MQVVGAGRAARAVHSALAGRCLGGCSTHGPSTRGREPRRGLATAGTAEERHRGREIMVAQCVMVASGRGFEV